MYHWPVYTPSTAPNLSKHLLLVVCDSSRYFSISDSIKNLGLVEFDHFIWYGLYRKKVCFINANCHGPLIAKYLGDSSAFRKKYGIHPFLAHASYFIKDKRPLDNHFLRHVDLLLYQNMLPTNNMHPTYADEYVLPRVSSSCQTICIPNYFPLGEMFHQTQELRVIRNGNCDAFYRDSLLDRAYNEGYRDVESIVKFVHSYRGNEDEVKTKFDSFMTRLEKRENRWDIKPVKWIKENYQKIPMMNDIAHPSKYLMLHTAKEILLKLCLQDSLEETKLRDYNYLHSYKLGPSGFVYPYVKNALGITYEDERIRKGWPNFGHSDGSNSPLHENGIDIYEFVKEYFLISLRILLPKDASIWSRKQIVSRSVVINFYRYLLGREPESEEIIKKALSSGKNFEEMRDIFLSSPEFCRLYRKNIEHV